MVIHAAADSSASVSMALQWLKTGSRLQVGRQLASRRQFSCSPCRLSNRVPPESPSYIRLPNPPQYVDNVQSRVRGFLPVPREIFSTHDGHRKTQPKYLEQTAPEPVHRRKNFSREQKWRDDLARSRRQNLRSGLDTLWSRKTKTDRLRNTRAIARAESHQAAAKAPERDDDQMTRGTVLESLMDTKVHSDPRRFERANLSRTNVQAAVNAKREARRDALMELYISASNFITSESDLKKTIEHTFSVDFFRKQGQATARYGTGNAWGSYGKPPSVAAMLEATKGSSAKLVDVLESEYDRSVKRQKRIAEEFTGGKM